MSHPDASLRAVGQRKAKLLRAILLVPAQMNASFSGLRRVSAPAERGPVPACRLHLRVRQQAAGSSAEYSAAYLRALRLAQLQIVAALVAGAL
jgi:hypothetical protein